MGHGRRIALADQRRIGGSPGSGKRRMLRGFPLQPTTNATLVIEQTVV